MSFILDALKKSESDRQRQSGPALFEVRVAPPRNSLPLWAVGLAVLLAVNLVIVAWVLLRRPAATEQPSSTAAAQTPLQTNQGAPTAPANGSYGGPGGASPGASGYAGYPGPQQGFGSSPSSPAVPVSGTGPTAPVGQTAGMSQTGGLGQPGAMGQPGALSQPGAVAQQGQGAGPGGPSAGYGQQAANANGVNGSGNTQSGGFADAGGERLNPDDYAPAADPPVMPGFANRVSRSTSNGVPLYQDAAQANHLPNLHLDLHVFAANPQQRFVMINTHKLHEGDSLPEGVRVESITPDGAVLSQNGTRFLLPRE